VAIIGVKTQQSILCFPTLSYEVYDSGEKNVKQKICVLIFCTSLYETCLTLGRIQRDISYVYIGLPEKYPFFLSDFYQT
jgi:hypothetical protein